MTEAIVFDLDDTLYLEREYVRSGFGAAGHWLEAQHGVPGFAELAWHHFLTGARGDVFDRALRQLGVPGERALVSELVAAYREHLPRLNLLPDARAALLRCRSAGVPTALLSDGFLVAQRRKVEALGIASFFDVIVLSDVWGREAWKPADRPYRELEKALAGRAARFVYVADNPEKDFVTARKLGWRTVRVLRAGGEHRERVARSGYEADHVVRTLDELDSCF